MSAVHAEAREALAKPASIIRGIYESDADPDFADVKTFDTGEAARSWYTARAAITNPKHASCTQIYTTLTDWDQVQTMLLSRLATIREQFPVSPALPIPESNLFSTSPAILAALRNRLDVPHHANTDEDSTLNTLRYLFYHMRCGIFVCIRQNRLRMFVPFVNTDYVNTWGDKLEIEGGSLEEYIKDKHDAGTRETYIMDRRKWWANGNIICNVSSPEFWGDAYLPQLRHMLQVRVRTTATCYRRCSP